MHRRTFIAALPGAAAAGALGAGWAAAAGAVGPAAAAASAASASGAVAGRANGVAGALDQTFAGLEPGSGGRLGVACVDTATGALHGHRLDDRFPLCSTFKMLLAALVLRRVERGEDSLGARVPFGRADLQEWSPVTAPAASRGGLDVGALCEAAITQSDNTAANLLLRRCGGPSALTAWLRSIGDDVTRLDREEPALNDWAPGQVLDTTTPRAMARTMGALLYGPALRPASRDTLRDWMRATRTGDHRLRAGLPAGWGVGDKTGTWRRATVNDVAFVEPPGRAPWIVVALLSSGDAARPVREPTLADVGRALAAAVDPAPASPPWRRAR